MNDNANIALYKMAVKYGVLFLGALIVVCIFGVIVSLNQSIASERENARRAQTFALTLASVAKDAGKAAAAAEYSTAIAQKAAMESRVTQSKIEGFRVEVAELKGLTEAKPKGK